MASGGLRLRLDRIQRLCLIAIESRDYEFSSKALTLLHVPDSTWRSASRFTARTYGPSKMRVGHMARGALASFTARREVGGYFVIDPRECQQGKESADPSSCADVG